MKTQLERSQAQYEEVRRELEIERAKTEAAESDLSLAFVVSFSCVLTVFLLLGLLLREHRSKKVMARFLHWLKQRGNSDGKREG